MSTWTGLDSSDNESESIGLPLELLRAKRRAHLLVETITSRYVGDDPATFAATTVEYPLLCPSS